MVRELGPLHAPIVRIRDHFANDPASVHLALIGPPEAVLAAWVIIEDQRPRMARIEQWPAGARLLAVETFEFSAMVLVELRPAPDRPAAVRVVLELSTLGLTDPNQSPQPSLRRAGHWAALHDVTTPDGLRAAVATVAAQSKRRNALYVRAAEAHQPPPERPPGECLALIRALRDDRGWERFVDAAGLDVFQWEGWFRRRVTHLALGAVAGSPLRGAIRSALLGDSALTESCDGQHEAFLASDDFTRPPRLHAVVLPSQSAAPVPARVPSIGAPHRVDPIAPPAEAVTLLRASVAGPLRVLSAAPTHDRGVLVAGVTPTRAALVVWRGGQGTVVEWIYHNMDPAVGSLAWVDARGDGYTELLVQSAQTLAEDPDGHESAEWLTVEFAVDPPDDRANEGRGSERWENSYWLMRAPGIDAAVTALLAVPTTGIPTGAAIELVRRAASPDWRDAATHNARWLEYKEPDMPTYFPRVRSWARSDPRTPRRIRCADDRPVCFAATDREPGEEWYWFTRTARGWRIAGAAVYRGS